MPRLLRALALALGLARLAAGAFEAGLFAGRAGAERCGGCPAPWRPWGVGGCYRLTAGMPWAEASEACRRMGAAMAVPGSLVENDFIVSIGRGEDFEGVYIDCQDREVEGRWQCGNFTHWSPGEPNSKGDEDCAAIVVNSNEMWLDVPCDYSFPAICRRDCVPVYCFTANGDGRLE